MKSNRRFEIAFPFLPHPTPHLIVTFCSRPNGVGLVTRTWIVENTPKDPIEISSLKYIHITWISYLFRKRSRGTRFTEGESSHPWHRYGASFLFFDSLLLFSLLNFLELTVIRLKFMGIIFCHFQTWYFFRWLSPGFIFLNLYFSFLMLCNDSEKCSLRLAFCNQIIGGGILVHNPWIRKIARSVLPSLKCQQTVRPDPVSREVIPELTVIRIILLRHDLPVQTQ